MPDPVVVARFVANHWLRCILDKYPSDCRWAAHPLAMVIGALDGETEPVNLGLDPDVWDDYRRHIDGTKRPRVPDNWLECQVCGTVGPPDKPPCEHFDPDDFWTAQIDGGGADE